MTKEEFIEIRNKYTTDLECIKALHVGKKKFYEWKVQFGLAKRGKEVNKKKKELANLSAEDYTELRKTCSSDVELANKLNLGKDAFYKIKKQIGMTRVYDHSEIPETTFLELYKQGLNDSEIATIIGTNGKRICALRNKLKIPNNTDKHLEFTPEQYQIFLGGLYGDSSLSGSRNGANMYFAFAHSLKQENYALWKYSKLNNLCFNPYYEHQYDSRTNKTYSRVCVRSYQNKLFTPYLQKFYKIVNGKKIKYIDEQTIYTLDDLGLAIWFMDDGCRNHYGYSLATNCFSLEDLEIVKQWFWDKYRISPTIHSEHTTYIGAKSRNIFKEIIKPYIHQDVSYKLGPE